MTAPSSTLRIERLNKASLRQIIEPDVAVTGAPALPRLARGAPPPTPHRAPPPMRRPAPLAPDHQDRSVT
ncbi:hypothetical protein GCM10010468_35710 [Actinocorallia longicatena]|uniref:FXSXX-COOH protein n=1 Tax=Actinocorallia longicatena TaxID=111803 RepID=A0ABP6QA11_9ACTN